MLHSIAGAAGRLADLPLPVGAVTRDGARAAARRELSKAVYHQDDPPPLLRAALAVLRFLGRLLDRLTAVAPGGGAGLVAIILLVVAVVVAVRLRVGPLARASAIFDPSSAGRALSAADHRRAADQLAARQRWADAVRERMRAIVRELEARGVLEPRPGRTALEVATEAGAAVPALAAELRDVAALFDEIWYGGRPATPASEALLRAADERVRSTRLVVGGAAAGQTPTPALTGPSSAAGRDV